MQDYLADNLRHLRKAEGYTQQELADVAGVPRATLASMEHGGANPGLQGVLSVARALNVTLDELVTAPPESRHFLVNGADVKEASADQGRYLARQLSPVSAKGIQIQQIELRPECDTLGNPHPRGSQEFFLVLSGVATVVVDEEDIDVSRDCLLQFPGHLPHRYVNRSRKNAVRAVSVIVLPMR